MKLGAILPAGVLLGSFSLVTNSASPGGLRYLQFL